VAAATSAALVPSAPRWVPVTITSRAGGRVPKLALADLGIIEDGVRQRATSIERWPLWLVIVLDVGRQIGPAKQLAVHRQLVYDLLYALGEDDHVAVVQYSDRTELIQPWTVNVHDAEQAVEAKFESGLEGQLWDSVTYAASDLLADKLGHRVVVVITDGVDDASREASYSRACDVLHDTATTLYIVNLSRYLEEQIRREAYGMAGVANIIHSPSYIGRRTELRQYAERLGEAPQKMTNAANESGGKLWLLTPDDDPSRIPALVWQQIEGQYMVAYVPERASDGRSTRPVRALSAYVTRGDIDVRTPPKLFVPIVSPRTAPSGVHLRRQ
jgi:VWFA-related protein